MRLRNTDQGPIAHDEENDRWVSVAGAGGGVLDLLALDAEGREEVEELIRGKSGDETAGVDPATAGLPFETRSMRAFMVFEDHVIDSSRALVRRFFPKPVQKTVAGFEKVTGKTFPALKPKAEFYERPPFYMGNHTAMLADGEEVRWPEYTDFLDFELELACVISRPVFSPSPEEAAEAIGGWFVLNDWSARDTQAHDARTNPFGPVVKAKTFANSVGADVISADRMPDWKRATGRVFVDGELWCEGRTADSAWDIGEMIAHAAQGEWLDKGDVISTGTMPGCCGLELDRWVLPGQTVRLEIDGIGDLTTRIANG